jgi:hypothetical protein
VRPLSVDADEDEDEDGDDVDVGPAWLVGRSRGLLRIASSSADFGSCGAGVVVAVPCLIDNRKPASGFPVEADEGADDAGGDEGAYASSLSMSAPSTSPSSLKRNLTVFPSDEAFHVETFLSGLLDDAQTLYGLSSLISSVDARTSGHSDGALCDVGRSGIAMQYWR